MKYHYTWLAWSVALLLPWVWLYLSNTSHRKVMWRTSLITALFGLTELIFVPRYGIRPASLSLLSAPGSTLRA